MMHSYSTGLTISVSRDITTTISDNTPRSYIDYNLLTDSLVRVDWAPVLGCADVDSCSEQFINIEINLKFANSFNSFFANVGQELADAIDSSGVPIVNDADFRLDCVFTLNTVNEVDVVRHNSDHAKEENSSIYLLREQLIVLKVPTPDIPLEERTTNPRKRLDWNTTSLTLAPN
ncbi:hypothetical protein J6590_043294 [Homalodisca vitripennis]|nr:hypothetical protein J6590_043294 [Homalodisca vitripennis]